MIGIIDYDAGNITSVKNALNHLNLSNKMVKTEEHFCDIDAIILPGVGSFGSSMERLNETGLREAIVNFVMEGGKYLGICLGLQLLFSKSEESPNIDGLGILEGEVVKFKGVKIPHIGWNEIIPQKEINITLGNFYAYFVNSYHVVPNNKDIIASTTKYGTEFVSSIEFDNIFATQFHPEKSDQQGLNLLLRWAKC